MLLQERLVPQERVMSTGYAEDYRLMSTGYAEETRIPSYECGIR